jgi:hypothetical protein
MTRKEICEQYDIDSHGIVRSSGKFEGKMLYVPAFWDLCLSGFADFEENGIFGLAFDDCDRETYPEIGAACALWLCEDDSGFVHAQEFETKEDYDEACIRLAAFEEGCV